MIVVTRRIAPATVRHVSMTGPYGISVILQYQHSLPPALHCRKNIPLYFLAGADIQFFRLQ